MHDSVDGSMSGTGNLSLCARLVVFGTAISSGVNNAVRNGLNNSGN